MPPQAFRNIMAPIRLRQRRRVILFPYELADAVLIFVLIAGPVAAMDIANLALPVDDHGTRHLIDMVGLADLIRRIEQYRKTDRLARQPLFDRRSLFVPVDSDQSEACPLF